MRFSAVTLGLLILCTAACGFPQKSDKSSFSKDSYAQKYDDKYRFESSGGTIKNQNIENLDSVRMADFQEF